VTQPHINVCFDLEKLGKEGMDKLFQIEKLFLEIGVSFDTGAGFGGRDWEWDWSLSGPIKLTLLNGEVTEVEEKSANG